MIEAYLFHAMFAVQIVLASVLIPRRLLLRACENLARNPPAAEDAAVVQLSLNRYRLANGAIAVIGAVLMAFLYFYMAQADWDEDPVPFWQTLYFLLQYAPIAVLSFIAICLNKTLRNSLANEKRRALLQRRGLFDFVAPAVVALIFVFYLLFIALAVYVGRHTVLVISLITLMYGLVAGLVYALIYGRKSDPRQSHAEHMHEIGSSVRTFVYSFLVALLSVIMSLLLVIVDNQQLLPFVVSTSFVAISLWTYMGMKTAPPAAPSGDLRTGLAR